VLLAHPEAFDLPADQIAEGYVFVAERAWQVLGFAVVLPTAETAGAAAELDGLFVEPGHWRAGIGRQLVAEAARRARAAGCTALDVTASPDAEPFYRRCGFVRTGVVQTRFDLAPRLRLALG
jgi:GNAT superfamily N-acetyltransferase